MTRWFAIVGAVVVVFIVRELRRRTAAADAPTLVSDWQRMVRSDVIRRPQRRAGDATGVRSTVEKAPQLPLRRRESDRGPYQTPDRGAAASHGPAAATRRVEAESLTVPTCLRLHQAACMASDNGYHDVAEHLFLEAAMRALTPGGQRVLMDLAARERSAMRQGFGRR